MQAATSHQATAPDSLAALLMIGRGPAVVRAAADGLSGQSIAVVTRCCASSAPGMADFDRGGFGTKLAGCPSR